MKLQRIKNLLPTKNKDSVASESPDRSSSTRSWSIRKNGGSAASYQPPQSTKRAGVKQSSRKNRASKNRLPPHYPDASATSNTPERETQSLEGLSAEEKRVVFAQKLKDLSQSLIGENHGADSSVCTPPTAPSTPQSKSPSSHHGGRTTVTAMTPKKTNSTVVDSVLSKRRSRSLGSDMKSIQTTFGITTFAPVNTSDVKQEETKSFRAINLVQSQGLSVSDTDDGGDNETTPTRETATAFTYGEQDAFTTIKDCSTMETKTMYSVEEDSRWFSNGTTLSRGFGTSFDQTCAAQTMDDYTTGFSQYTTECNQTQYTDARTQATNYTAVTDSTRYSKQFWYNVLFSCTEPGTCATVQEDAETSTQLQSIIEEEEEEYDRGPMNPCTAPYGAGKRTTPGCMAASNTKLASFLSLSEDDEDDEEKRSHRSPTGTRFAADDIRQTSFASSDSSHSSSSSSNDSTEESSYYDDAARPESFEFVQDPAYPNGSKPNRKAAPLPPQDGRRRKHVEKQQRQRRKQGPPPFLSPRSTSPRDAVDQIAFVTSNYGGRQSSIPITTPVRTEPNWFLKRAAAGFRRKPAAAIEVPVADSRYLDDDDYYHSEADNSTISTKFSLMALQH